MALGLLRSTAAMSVGHQHGGSIGAHFVAESSVADAPHAIIVVRPRIRPGQSEMMMIDVYIVENNGLRAECTIENAPGDEFYQDLERLKSVPWHDREYDDQTKVWTIINPEEWVGRVEEIGPALEMHKRQLRMFD